MAYLLDTNVFIDAKARHYGLDFCPGFWDWLAVAGQSGSVASIIQVRRELQDDELDDWLDALGANFFRQPDVQVLEAMARVSQWIDSQPFTPAAKTTFFDAADYHLIAHTLAGKHVLVTHEQIEHTQARIKIPNVCIEMNVPYMRTHEMLRSERVRLILAK